MKKLQSAIIFLTIALNLWAQSPEKLSYQAIVRNAKNELVTNRQVGMRISILRGSANGTSVYMETQTPTTNANGLVSIEIGTGSTSNDFSFIDWANGPYFIHSETDPKGGTDYTISGSTQLLSVPYALYAKMAGKANISGNESVFDPWDKNWQDDVMTKFDQTIHGRKVFMEPIRVKGLCIPYTFGFDSTYVADSTAYIGFGHSGYSEDFIGYKNNRFYYKDSPGGADVTDPDIIIGGKLGIGIEEPLAKLDVNGTVNVNNHAITNVSAPVNSQDAATKAYVDGQAPKSYSVGDFAQGGVVFYIDESGQHGLVCAMEDQGAEVRWYAGTHGHTRALGDGPFAGKANTAIIIAAHVAIGDDGSSYAARICNELQLSQGGMIYGDWYLPSVYELVLMYDNRAIINATSTANGGSAFASDFYWSSTEYSNDHAWVQYFVNHAQKSANTKANTIRVRAVRAF